MLQEQLAIAESLRLKQEQSIVEANDKLSEQQAHFQQRINQQQIHITALADENTNLKKQNSYSLKDKEALQKEVASASDYILEVQEKCYESSKQALNLL